MAFWIVWLLIGLTFVLLFTGLVIPRVMLKMRAAMMPVRDKAVDHLSDEHGAIFVYTPSASARRYIKSYRISHDGEGLCFQGEWTGTVAFAEYELTVYNAENDIVEVLRVKEKFNGTHLTRMTKLPPKADYVTLRVLCVDDSPVVPERRAFGLRYAVWLAALCLSLALTVDILLWLGMLFVIRCLDGFTMSLALPVGVWTAVLGITAAAVVACTAAVCLAKFFFLNRKGDVYES